MKTRYFSIFGLALGVLALVGSLSNAAAQGNSIKSDTIRFATPDSTYFNLQNFSRLNVGQTECHTIFFRNATGSPVIIRSIENLYARWHFKNNPIPSLPLVLLNGEIISLTDLCFAPQQMVNDTGGYTGTVLNINYSIGSKSGELTAQTEGSYIADTLLQKECVTASMDGDIFGPVIMDGDVSHTITLTSNRHDTLYVMSYFYPDSTLNVRTEYFSISGITFPYKLKPLEVKTFTLTFSPRSNVPIVKYRVVDALQLVTGTGLIDSPFVYIDGQCFIPWFTLPGVAIPPTDPTTSTSLAAGSTDVLGMISDNSITTNTFHFKNTGTTTLKITAVDLKNKKSFAITDIQPTTTLPFTLAPGESMSVTVAMTTVSNGVYYDEVIITAENAIISMSFPLQGLRKNGTQAGVAGDKNETHFALYPNPSHGEITVSIPGVQNAKIEVLDLLGRVITKEIASEKWIWKSKQPAGTYIVHVSGTDQTGKIFQSYDRFLIE